MKNGVEAVWVWTKQMCLAVFEQERCDMQCDTEDGNEKPRSATGCGRAECSSMNEDREVWSLGGV